MSEFNSNDHYIYYHGQEYHRRNRIALIINKRVRNTVFGCKLKNDRMISVHFQATNTKEAEVEWFYEDLQDLLELTPKKDMSFSS